VRLEEMFPHLRGERLTLGSWPTPVRRLDVGSAQLWCKDEGGCARPYGGNKVRKLEWILPRVRPRGVMVTFGAAGSNHVLACCVYGAKAGVRVHAVLVPQPATAKARANAAVISRLAHRVWPARSLPAAGTAFARAASSTWREEGCRPAMVWAGGTTPRGVLGWVQAGLEIAAEVDPSKLEIDERWIGSGYGVPTRAGDEAMEVARGVGLEADPVYTAKALAAALDAARSGAPAGPVLWVNTVNSHPLEDVLGEPVPEPGPEMASLLRRLPGQ
jgi:D-cysteine desulfhydrase